MPPRRRGGAGGGGKATSARSAAIQAVQRKRRAQQPHDDDAAAANASAVADVCGDDDVHNNNNNNNQEVYPSSPFDIHHNDLTGATASTAASTADPHCNHLHHHNHSHSHNHTHSSHSNSNKLRSNNRSANNNTSSITTNNNSNNNSNRKQQNVVGRKRSHNEDFIRDYHHQHHHQHQHQHQHPEEELTDDDNEDDDDDDDCPPPLVGNDEEFIGDDFDGPDDDEDDDDDSENFDSEAGDDDDNAVAPADANDSSNTMSGEGGCLHCHTNAAAPTEIQVRCDECQAFICQNCHWCHEFQANHEIRVCDRCDAFYCRTCDEMDQCDDCGEVVCATCSTLLSCKFCGGGLCEECATACGRCGIVLCSRDAKFAVDCDTCRLSYCLVCLASGSKDPCVRCGHRPSKRMEQLVHLRLKSIYKAFKQSSRNSKYGGGGPGGPGSPDGGGGLLEDGGMEDGDEEDDDGDDNTNEGKPGDPQSLLHAAASAASKHSSSAKSNASRHHQHHHHHPSHGNTTTASSSSKRPNAAAANASRDKQAKAMVDKYMAEKEKADAAAAALLAELEEEEQAEKSKKNKKKRKKERERAKKEEEMKKHDPEAENALQSRTDDISNNNDHDDDESFEEDNDDDDGDIDLKRVAPSTAKKGAATGDGTEQDSKKKKKKKKKQSDQIANQKDDKNDNAQYGPAEKEQKEEDKLLPLDSEAESGKTKGANPEVDPVEQQLVELVNDEDIDGIEQILSALKGVPGRAALRKNAKKALKRLKQQQEEEEAEALAQAQRLAEEEAAASQKREAEKAQKEQHRHHSASGAGTPATQSETNSSSVGNSGSIRQPPPPLPPNELIRLVSQTHNKPVTVPGTTNSPHPHRGTRGQTPAASSSTAVARSECVLHIAPNVVGWLIGKGGQRIRDLMEETGAKVWIDQEHMKEHDPRIVYISGNRKNVEAAARMVQDLVAKSPLAPAAAAAPTPVPSHTPVARSSSAPVSDPSTPPNAAEVSASERGRPITAAGVVAGSTPSQTMLHSKQVGIAYPGAEGVAPLNTLFAKTSEAAAPSSTDVTGIDHTLGNNQRHAHAIGIANYNEHEMTCEACFVPLLIGRRGWTIKHIQDSSGARVDIDQTVTPRKIRISGEDKNVQAAIRMVRDVLSYPHAQLQGAAVSGEDIEHRDTRQVLGADLVAATATSLEQLHVGESTGATQSNTTTVGASNQIVFPGMQASPVGATQPTERVHTPPPSSTINIGDAKDTISASSSLSSTPEPSMASSSKGHFSAAGLSGPLFPPEFGVGGSFSQQHPSLSNSNMFGHQNSLPQMNLGNMADNHGSSGGMMPPQHSVPPLFPGSVPGSNLPSNSSGYDMQSGPHHGYATPHRQQQQHMPHLQQRQHESMPFGPPLQHPANLRSVNGLGGIPHQNLHFQPHPEQQNVLHHSQSLRFPTGEPAQQGPVHFHQQSAFHQNQGRHNSASELGIGNMGHNSAQDLGGNLQHNPHGNLAPPGMWNERNSSLDVSAESPSTGHLHHPAPSDRYRLHSIPTHGHNVQNKDAQMNTGRGSFTLGDDFIGLPGATLDGGIDAGFRQAGGAQPSLLATSGRDDSRMVDSLFGPSDGGGPEKESLLPGFQGLSLGDGLSTDPWAKSASAQSWSGSGQKTDFRDGQKGSALFAAIQPTLDAQDVAHPSRSRFGFNESQGQSS